MRPIVPHWGWFVTPVRHHTAHPPNYIHSLCCFSSTSKYTLLYAVRMMHIKYLNTCNESTSHLYPKILFRKNIVEFIHGASACSLTAKLMNSTICIFKSQHTGLCLQMIFPSAVLNPLIHSDNTLR